MGDFDEEADEREMNSVLKLVEGFVDEPPILHNVYPETDSEEETEEGGVSVGRQRSMVRFGQDETVSDFVGLGNGTLQLGQTFFNVVGFKEEVFAYALKTGRNLRQYRYDKDKVGFECVGGGSKGSGEECVWLIYASTLPKDKTWTVRKYVDSHTCVPNGKCELLRALVLARLFVDKIREEPSYFLPMKIEEVVYERWQILVSRPQCQAARNTALKWIEREHDQQFSRLRDYAAELLDSNYL